MEARYTISSHQRMKSTISIARLAGKVDKRSSQSAHVMVNKDVVEQLSFSEKKVLKALHELKRGTPEELLKKSGLSQQVEVMNASSWLQAKGLVKIDESFTKNYSLRKPEVASRPLPEKVS